MSYYLTNQQEFDLMIRQMQTELGQMKTDAEVEAWIEAWAEIVKDTRLEREANRTSSFIRSIVE